jgi:hypothetical protein
MADYSIWILGESNVSITGGVTLDGITQGDGSHLVGNFLTINSTASTEVFISDAGSETNFSDNDSGQRLDGAQTIDGVVYANNTQIEAEYQFVLSDDATGIQYTALAVNVVNSSPAYGTNEAIAFVGTAPPSGVSLRVVSASEGPPNSGPNAIDATEIVPICFCKHTQIHMKDGTQAVEKLKSGDLVLRADGSFAKVRKVFQTKLERKDLDQQPKLRPVRITSGALGKGLPKRDLLVSRQHRMLVSSRIAERMFGVKEVLISAIKLTPVPGIFIDEDVNEVEYFHLIFDDHEIIFAEGAPTESLFIGPEALMAIGSDARDELLCLFPNIAKAEFSAVPVRYIPAGKLQNKLVQRHVKHVKPLLI